MPAVSRYRMSIQWMGWIAYDMETEKKVIRIHSRNCVLLGNEANYHTVTSLVDSLLLKGPRDIHRM